MLSICIFFITTIVLDIILAFCLLRIIKEDQEEDEEGWGKAMNDGGRVAWYDRWVTNSGGWMMKGRVEGVQGCESG